MDRLWVWAEMSCGAKVTTTTCNIARNRTSKTTNTSKSKKRKKGKKSMQKKKKAPTKAKMNSNSTKTTMMICHVLHQLPPFIHSVKIGWITNTVKFCHLISWPHVNARRSLGKTFWRCIVACKMLFINKFQLRSLSWKTFLIDPLVWTIL